MTRPDGPKATSEKKTDTNIGMELVKYSIELNKQWVLIHKYLYYRGEGIISDLRYDSSYGCYEDTVGHEEDMPPLPKYAKIKEEAEHFNLPLWDHMEEFRRRNG